MRLGNNVSIRTKVIGFVIILLVFTGAVGVVGTMGINKVNAVVAEISQVQAPAGNLLLNIDRDAYQAAQAIEVLLRARTDDERSQAIKNIDDNTQQTLDRWNAYKALGSNLEGEKELQATFERNRQTWVASMEQVKSLGQAATPEAIELALPRMPALESQFQDMRDLLNQMEEMHDAESARLAKEAEAVSASSRQLVLLFSLVGLGFGLVLGIWL
ncbi:MAG: MCP four helix bundle domain-containing protein, partial [Bacillota bacterium]